MISGVSFLVALGLFASLVQKNQFIDGFYSPVTRAWEFLSGALLALAITRLTVVPYKVGLPFGLLGAVLLISSPWLITRSTPFPGVWTLLPVTGTLLVIFVGIYSSNIITSGLAARPIVKVGDWSYSIYLWHWPLIVFAALVWPDKPQAIVIAALLSFVPAIASYAMVEQPLRNLQRVSASRVKMLLAATLIPPLLLGLVLLQGARTWFWNEALAATMTSLHVLPTGWGQPLCISRIPVNKRDTDQCKWEANAIGSPIYLVGDSNAMHFSEALKGAGEKLNRPVTTLGTHGCPLIDVFLDRRSDVTVRADCRENYVAMIEWLTKSPPGLVMIASVDRYWRSDDYLVSIDGNFSKADDPLLNADRLKQGLLNTVERLQKVGHTVLLLQTIPHYVVEPFTLADHCNGLEVLSGHCQPAVVQMPLGFANEWQKASRLAIIDVAAKTGATVFDFRDYFCPEGTCSNKIDGIYHYQPDGYHLNKGGSAQLTKTLIKAIVSVSPSRVASWSLSTPAK